MQIWNLNLACIQILFNMDCFLYNHMKEIDWMPSPTQVASTLPPAFRGYSSTFIIVDASEIFLETPSDLRLHSSTWSSYKHYNTAKLLVCCTPNGVISFVSPSYFGGISDDELTRVSGLRMSLLTNLEFQ